NLSPLRGRKHHLGEAIVSGTAALHADVDATTRGRQFVGVENDIFREHEVDGSKCRTADRQIVEKVFVHEVRKVTDHCLRVHVVRRRIFWRGAGEVECKPVSALDQGQVARTNQGRRPANRVIKNNAAEFAVGQAFDLLKCSSLRHIEHSSHQADNELYPSLLYLFKQAYADAIRGGAAGAQVRDKHGRGAQPVD